MTREQAIDETVRHVAFIFWDSTVKELEELFFDPSCGCRVRSDIYREFARIVARA